MTRVKAFVGRRILHKSVQGTTRGNTMSARAGMNDVLKEYARFVKHVQEQTPAVLVEALEPTFALSKKYVPKDTGALEESGYLVQTTFRGKPVVEVGYGSGGVPDYAATVHENLVYKHAAPTKAKFLEHALTEDFDNVKARVVNLLKLAGGTE